MIEGIRYKSKYEMALNIYNFQPYKYMQYKSKAVGKYKLHSLVQMERLNWKRKVISVSISIYIVYVINIMRERSASLYDYVIYICTENKNVDI
jgi:hypothetical protein